MICAGGEELAGRVDLAYADHAREVEARRPRDFDGLLRFAFNRELARRIRTGEIPSDRTTRAMARS